MLIQSTLEDFQVEGKIFLILRDAAAVMIKTCDDLGFKSIDCLAHKLNLVRLINIIIIYQFLGHLGWPEGSRHGR
jgi:hypothetical protein